MTTEDRLAGIELRLTRLEALLGDLRAVAELRQPVANPDDDASAQSAFMSPAFMAEAEADQAGQREAALERNKRYLEALAGLRGEGWVTEDGEPRQ